MLFRSKHGSKHLASKLCNIVNLDNGRCDKCAIARIVAELDLLNNMASSAHFLDIPLNILPRVLRTHRPDIDGEPVGLADAELSHGTLEHCEQIGKAPCREGGGRHV